MNYSWNWGVLFEQTGIGNELYIHWMITGLGWLLLIGSIAWAIAMVVGTIFGIMRTLPNKAARSIGTAYVTFFRNIPLLVQLFFWFYIAPGWLTPAIQDWWYKDLSPNTSAMLSASIGLGLFTAARIVEQVQAYKEVLLPQAFRIILPPLSSELTNCFKNASVASLVGVMELISQTKTISEYTQNSLEIYTYATIIYLVFNLSLIAIMGLIERKLRVPGLIAGGQK